MVHAGLLILLLTPPAPSAPQEAPEAVVIEVQGAVSVDRAGGDGTEALRVGDLLEAGDLVAASPGARTTLLERDGQPRRVEAEWEVDASGGAPAPVFLRTAELILRFAERAGYDTEKPSEPAGPTPRPAVPANGIPVRVLTPTLHWLSGQDVELYRVTLISSGQEIHTFDVESDTFAIVPPESALTPGEAYQWSVEAFPGDERSPSVRFRVLDREGMDRVAEEMRDLRQTELDPESVGRLPAVALFQEMELLYDALASLEELIEAGEEPVNPALLTLRGYLRAATRPPHSDGGTGGTDAP